MHIDHSIEHLVKEARKGKKGFQTVYIRVDQTSADCFELKYKYGIAGSEEEGFKVMGAKIAPSSHFLAIDLLAKVRNQPEKKYTIKGELVEVVDYLALEVAKLNRKGENIQIDFSANIGTMYQLYKEGKID